MSDNRMKLRPLDFSLLKELRKGRNVAANLYVELDVSRPYVNNRLSMLEDYGVVRRIGPNPSAGLYEITLLGEVVLENREAYYDDDVDFDELIEDALGPIETWGDVDEEDVEVDELFQADENDEE